MSAMSQCYSVLFDRGISSPGHGKEMVYGINAIGKLYINQVISNVKLPGWKTFD